MVEKVVCLTGESHTIKRESFEVRIPWPEKLQDGVRFSTNPDQCILTMDAYHWHERVDFTVENRILQILFYLKPGQLLSIPDGSEWFPDDFRAEVHERVRQRNATHERAEAKENGE